MGSSEILNWEPPANYAVDFPYNGDGIDAEGRPIIIVPLGIWDPRKAANAGEQEIWLRYYDQIFAKALHKMKFNSEKYGREVKDFVLILDYENYSMKQFMCVAGNDVKRTFSGIYVGTCVACDLHYFILNNNKLFSRGHCT